MPNGGAFDMDRKRKVMKMGKRNDFMLFPGGKKKAMTFSYDDGVIQDRRLVELFNRYHVKGTFNLNTETLGFQGFADFQGKHVDISKIAPQEVASLYQGHEVGGTQPVSFLFAECGNSHGHARADRGQNSAGKAFGEDGALFRLSLWHL